MRRKDRQLTDKDDILQVIEKADACRIAFAVNNVPYIVCLNYGFEWEGELPVFYFHCAHEGRKIDLMRQNNYVCFQLDTGHELGYVFEKVYCTMYYASVVGMGYLEIVNDDAGRKKALDLLMRHHNSPVPEVYPESSMKRTLILQLKVSEITAKKNEKNKK